MTFRHATNLQLPLKGADLSFIAILKEYRIGAPVPEDPAKRPTAKTFEQLCNEGYIGLYLEEGVFADALFRRVTGWDDPAKILGIGWEPWPLR